MKIKKYTNGAWTDLDKPVKKYDTYTDEATTLPLTIQTSATDAVENYEVFGASSGAGEETENLYNLRLWQDTYPDNVTVDGDTVYINSFVIAMLNAGISVDVPSGWYFTVIPVGAQSGTTANRGRLRLIDENGTAHVYYVTNQNRNPLPKISEQLDFAVKKIGIDYTDMGNGFGIKQLMFTSTAPTSYIPFGYKIPILNTSGVTENLFDIVQYLTKREAPYVYVNGYYCFKRAASRFYYNKEDISDYKNKYLLLENNIELTNVELFRIELLNEDSEVIKSTPSDTEHYTLLIPENTKYLRLNWSAGGGDDIAIRVSITEFSPDHYIPHRYTSNYDLFIGSTKLGAEEYVDYQEQKVYKRTENLCPTLSNWVDGYINPTGNIASPLPVTLEKSSDFIEVSSNTLYTFGIIDGFPFIENSLAWRGIAYYDVNQTFISRTADYLTENLTNTTPVNAKYVRLTYRTYGQTNSPMLVEGSTAPETYIPYLQPTDPPVPLPPIPTYKGENTLSSTETLGEVTVKYEGWKGVGDVEKYQNGEWSDNNGT